MADKEEEKLSSTEDNIIKLGDDIYTLLETMKSKLEGKNIIEEDAKQNLKNILENCESIRNNMHLLVEDIYSLVSFPNHSKLRDDSKETRKEISKINQLIMSYKEDIKKEINNCNNIKNIK